MRIAIKLADFVNEAKKRFGDDNRKWKFKCPSCGAIQSAEDFSQLDCFKDKKGEINKFIGFSCIGRFTRENEKEKFKGCNWTLGGLFQIHALEIEDNDGKMHKHFELADS